MHACVRTHTHTHSYYKEKQALYDRYYKNLLEERLRMLERPEDLQQILDAGDMYVKKIRECNDIIKDKDITEKLNQMEKIVAMIFREVDLNPKHARKLGMFMNYYLPTTEKLLTEYINLSSRPIIVANIEKTKQEIKNSLTMINKSFEGILNQFFQEQEMDIATDIVTMEAMMRQDGLASSQDSI